MHPYPTTHGFSDWFEGEHTAYNTAFEGYNSSVFLAAGSDASFTSAAYHLATWAGPFAGMPAPSPARTVHIKDLDFYAFDGERIVTNYCMVDVLDILRQGGVRLLPPNASTLVDDGLYPPPRASHGLPAPNSVYADPSLRVRRSELEALLLRAIHADLVQQDRRARDWAADAPWYGPGGVGRAPPPLLSSCFLHLPCLLSLCSLLSLYLSAGARLAASISPVARGLRAGADPGGPRQAHANS